MEKKKKKGLIRAWNCKYWKAWNAWKKMNYGKAQNVEGGLKFE